MRSVCVHGRWTEVYANSPRCGQSLNAGKLRLRATNSAHQVSENSMFTARSPSGPAALYMTGANVGINVYNPQAPLDVGGQMQVGKQVTFASTTFGNNAAAPLGNPSADRLVLLAGDSGNVPYSYGVAASMLYSSVPASAYVTNHVAGQVVTQVGVGGLTINGGLSVSGNAVLGGAAGTVVSVPGSLSLVNAASFTGNYAELANKPSPGPTYAATGAAAPATQSYVKTYYGTGSVTSGAATFYPTANGTAGGSPLFTTILNVQASVVVNTSTGTAVAFAGLRSVSTTAVVVNAYTVGTGLAAAAAAPNGSPVYLLVAGV